MTSPSGWQEPGQRPEFECDADACQPWLEREIEVVKPPILVCLGSTAAQALLGRDFRVTARRGQPFETQWSPWTMATVHPSSLLRIPDRDVVLPIGLFTRTPMYVRENHPGLIGLGRLKPSISIELSADAARH